MRISTEELKQIVAPASIEDTLEALLQRGAIESYSIGVCDTEIKVSKHAEIAVLMGEESVPRDNPRPYIKNKTLTKKNK